MLRIQRINPKHEAVIAVHGQVGVESIGAFRRCLRAIGEEARGDVLIDAAGIDYIYSEGIEALLALRQTLMARGGSLRIIRPSPSVSRLLAMVRLEELLLADAA